MTFRGFWLLLFAIVSVKGEEFFKPCPANDFECVKAATESLVANTYAGNSKYGMQPLDPLIISSTDIDFDKDFGLIFHYKNSNVTGFKNLKVTDFKMEANKESFTIQADLSIDSDVDVEITKVNKTFKGTSIAHAKYVGKAEYGISLKDIDGKQYFVVGPETITCEIIGEPTMTAGSELMAALNNDEDVNRLRPDWEVNSPTMTKKILCAIANYGMTTFVNNARSIAKVLDKNAFILNE